MQLYFYADEESIELLESMHSKALLVGGDFGYGNFGDVLQHVGSLQHIRAWSRLKTASVFSLDALSRHIDAVSLRNSYAVDALLFVSENPIAEAELKNLGLRIVSTIRNISFLHLYGGGYLNRMWGDFVLKVAGEFLAKLPGVTYVMSGQQLSSDYVQQAKLHVEKFNPRLVGFRDQASLSRARASGVLADFSFDDAVEPLLRLRHKFELRKGNGAFIHLNTSGYTGNSEVISEMLSHLQNVAFSLGGQGRGVLLQAFQDARENVIDSIETVKRLEAGFPFSDIEIVLLVRAILSEGVTQPHVLQGRFGYSSSYHVTLWLQLNGIPCWLRGSNGYYMQKREALGIQGRFEDFMENMPCPTHDENLHARACWLSKLSQVLEAVPYVANKMDWESGDENASTHAFHYKGEPRLEEKLDETWKTMVWFRGENERMTMEIGQARELIEELEGAATEKDALRDRLDVISRLMEKKLSEHSSTTEKLLEATGLVASLKVELKYKENIESDLAAEIRCKESVESNLVEQLSRVKFEYESLLSDLTNAKRRELLFTRRMDAVYSQVTMLGAQHRDLEKRASEAEGNCHAAYQSNERLSADLNAALSKLEFLGKQLSTVQSRLVSCNEQLTAVGVEARRYREDSENSHVSLLEYKERERQAMLRLEEAMGSKSWRWTRPVRMINRFFRTGRFDAEGTIGLFEMLRILGRKVPVPASWRSGLGRWLEKMRRN